MDCTKAHVGIPEFDLSQAKRAGTDRGERGPGLAEAEATPNTAGIMMTRRKPATAKSVAAKLETVDLECIANPPARRRQEVDG